MTAHRCLFVHGPVAGKTVLVAGGGGVVGNIAVQMARWAGARVIATAGSAASMDHARQAGAHEVLDYRDPDAYRAIGQLTSGRGVDLVVEVDLAANAARSLEVLAPGATVACYSSLSDREPRIPFYAWAAKSVSLACILVYEMTDRQREQAVGDIWDWARSDFCNVAVAPRCRARNRPMRTNGWSRAARSGVSRHRLRLAPAPSVSNRKLQCRDRCRRTRPSP
jgi:NADPH2:quinone reductase